jgi:hypothetical protein
MLTPENNRDNILLSDENTDRQSNGGIVAWTKKTTAIKKERGNDNMKQPEYLMASQVAEIMGSKWSRQRVHVELKRGKFPEPSTYVGNQPLWTPEQIERAKKERGIEQ